MKLLRYLDVAKVLLDIIVMYSDRLKRRYYQGKRWAEAGPYTA